MMRLPFYGWDCKTGQCRSCWCHGSLRGQDIRSDGIGHVGYTPYWLRKITNMCTYHFKDHSGYGLSQWETAWQSKAVPQWLSPSASLRLAQVSPTMTSIRPSSRNVKISSMGSRWDSHENSECNTSYLKITPYVTKPPHTSTNTTVSVTIMHFTQTQSKRNVVRWP